MPRAFAPALTGTVLEAQDAYHDAADASIRAARDLDEIAIAIAAPSKTLALAQAAAPVQTRRRGGCSTWPDEDGSHPPPHPGVSFRHSRASTGLPGPVERAVRARRADDPVVLLRAVAIDNAARQLIGLADNESAPPEPGVQETIDDVRHCQGAVELAAQGFPDGTVLPPSASASFAGKPADPVAGHLTEHIYARPENRHLVSSSVYVRTGTASTVLPRGIRCADTPGMAIVHGPCTRSDRSRAPRPSLPGYRP